jgi:acyl-CoA hydrolase
MSLLSSPEQAIDQLIQEVGQEIVLAAPLAAGKANHLLNAIYTRAKKDPQLKLTILTALTLQKPKGQSDLEKRFLDPFADRVFGDYPNLLYEEDRVADELPSNVKVIEFYYKAGQFKDHSYGQRNYLSSNYTHVVRDSFDRGVNVICQQVCKGEIEGDKVYSLSCNPDTSRDLHDLLKASGRKFVAMAQVNQDLPFMFGESIVGEDHFDIVVDDRKWDFPVFAPPKMPVSDADYMIGLHSSTLIKDDGEIQIGIGSLGDALVYGLCLRQQNNSVYRQILQDLEISQDVFPLIAKEGDLSGFEIGLFAATEMLVDSFADLYQNKILKKRVYDSPVIQRLINQKKMGHEVGVNTLSLLYGEKAIHRELTENDTDFLKEFGVIRSTVQWQNDQLELEDGSRISNSIFDEDIKSVLGTQLRNGAVVHGGFFLGCRAFYDFLKNLPVKERKLFRMKRISQINQLYGHEEIDRLQRINGRFVNTCMKVTLNGSANSDALEDLNQISGVGGQYNFVAMAHELPSARSILQLRSTRTNKKGKLESNIVFNYGNCTIPRHLRDVVVTEYGIADLRGKTNEEVATALINISDSRFQSELIAQSQKAKLIGADFTLQNRFSNNLPGRYVKVLKKFKQQDHFKPFPLGGDLTDVELQLAKALKRIKKQSQSRFFVLTILKSLLTPTPSGDFKAPLERMGLDQVQNFKEKIYRKLLINSLAHFRR